jgi:nitronate monooxygenase
MTPDEITMWCSAVRAATDKPFQLNLWIPGPAAQRDPTHEAQVRDFLGRFGPSVPAADADKTPPDFAAQCEAMLTARPAAISSIMGLFPADFVARAKRQGITWLATATTVDEAKRAEDAGADVIIAQGAEAGGHRGSFRSEDAETRSVGLFSLLPCVVDAVRVPVVAAGGISDARGVAAALLLGASAVQAGTAFLRCPEAELPRAWADGLARARPEDTVLTRAFSGRAGRGLETAYVRAARDPSAPHPAPYPVQRGLTAKMRAEAAKQNDVERMQAWAGQSASLARAIPAMQVVSELWEGARRLLT